MGQVDGLRAVEIFFVRDLDENGHADGVPEEIALFFEVRRHGVILTHLTDKLKLFISAIFSNYILIVINKLDKINLDDTKSVDFVDYFSIRRRIECCF